MIWVVIALIVTALLCLPYVLYPPHHALVISSSNCEDLRIWQSETVHIRCQSNVDFSLSSTLPEIDPDTAYVVCISVCPYFLIWYPYAPTSLYGNTVHCSAYGVAMGCYRLCIVPRIAIVTSQWYDRYCFTEYARTWARHPTTPWQRECTAITDCQSIDSL